MPYQRTALKASARKSFIRKVGQLGLEVLRQRRTRSLLYHQLEFSVNDLSHIPMEQAQITVGDKWYFPGLSATSFIQTPIANVDSKSPRSWKWSSASFTLIDCLCIENRSLPPPTPICTGQEIDLSRYIQLRSKKKKKLIEEQKSGQC